MIAWQVAIHLTFVVSSLALAWIDRLTFRVGEREGHAPGQGHGHPA